MIASKRQNKEIEEMLIQEFSSLSNLGNRFTYGDSPDARKGLVQAERIEKKSIVMSGMYLQPKSQPYHSEPKGICSNCSNFKGCQLPKNPAGVWHCEEYL